MQTNNSPMINKLREALPKIVINYSNNKQSKRCKYWGEIDVHFCQVNPRVEVDCQILSSRFYIVGMGDVFSST